MIIQLLEKLAYLYGHGMKDEEIIQDTGIPDDIFESDLYKEIKLTLSMVGIKHTCIERAIILVRTSVSAHNADTDAFDYVYTEPDSDCYYVPCQQLLEQDSLLSILVQGDTFAVFVYDENIENLMAETGKGLDAFNEAFLRAEAIIK